LKTTGIAAALALLVVTSPVAAQQQLLPPPPDADNSISRMRLGPLWVNPSIALSNAGVDTNVFNEPEDQHPKRDFTFAVMPQSDIWLRMGRTWLGGVVKEDLLWYQTYASERAANENYTFGWLAPLTRVSFAAEANLVDTRDRAGYEIEARLQHTDLLYDGSAELRALSKTYVGVRGSRRRVDYSGEATYDGQNVRNQLNRTETSVELTLRYQVTPLTSVLFEGGRQQDRFELDPLRDSDSTRVSAALTFDPFALIKGSARVGYRRFEPFNPTIPAYDGPTAQVDLSYVALGSTKLSAQYLRDVQYSYQVTQPYYVQSGGTFSVTQRIAGPVDAGARLTMQQMAYRNREGLDRLFGDRIDHVRMYGGSVGYHVGPDLRVAFNADRQTRDSDLDVQRFEGLRMGVSVGYGF
jgi:Putative beta-barrel porin 2